MTANPGEPLYQQSIMTIPLDCTWENWLDDKEGFWRCNLPDRIPSHRRNHISNHLLATRDMTEPSVSLFLLVVVDSSSISRVGHMLFLQPYARVSREADYNNLASHV